MIRAHAVETRRNIQIVKNDTIRVRAQCFGVVPEPIKMTKDKIKMTKGIIIGDGVKNKAKKRSNCRVKLRANW